LTTTLTLDHSTTLLWRRSEPTPAGSPRAELILNLINLSSRRRKTGAQKGDSGNSRKLYLRAVDSNTEQQQSLHRISEQDNNATSPHRDIGIFEIYEHAVETRSGVVVDSYRDQWLTDESAPHCWASLAAFCR